MMKKKKPISQSSRYQLISKRREKNLSQTQMASLLGISRSFYNQLENGTRNPGFRTLKLICSKLDLDLQDWG